MILNKSAIDFGSKVARRALQGGRSPHLFEVQLRNNTDSTLLVAVGSPAAADAFRKPSSSLGSTRTDASKQQAAGKGEVPASSAYTVEGWDTRPAAPFVTLGSDETLAFAVRFSPTEARLYEACVPVFLDGSRAAPYMCVQLTGTGTLPRMTFDVAECVLPMVSFATPLQALPACCCDSLCCSTPRLRRLVAAGLVWAGISLGVEQQAIIVQNCVRHGILFLHHLLLQVPLGITSKRRVYVVNDGYDNLELSVRLLPDSTRLPVTVAFPEGKLIGLAKERLPLDISCCSSKPLSFTTCVDLLDEDGRAFSLTVSGAADSCSLSHGVFMQVRQAPCGPPPPPTGAAHAGAS